MYTDISKLLLLSKVISTKEKVKKEHRLFLTFMIKSLFISNYI